MQIEDLVTLLKEINEIGSIIDTKLDERESSYLDNSTTFDFDRHDIVSTVTCLFDTYQCFVQI